jgi:hypothetical protein
MPRLKLWLFLGVELGCGASYGRPVISLVNGSSGRGASYAPQAGIGRTSLESSRSAPISDVGPGPSPRSPAGAAQAGGGIVAFAKFFEEVAAGPR